jgi:hypothetical protein
MKVTLPLTVSALSLLLTGCAANTVKEAFGIDNRAPDEFRVVSRPPLSVPPQFELRPPSADGAPTDTPAYAKAQSLVTGDPNGVTADTAVKPVAIKSLDKTAKGSDKSTTAAESNFLSKAGAAQADPEVKQKLTEEKIAQQIKKEEDGESMWNRITFQSGSKEPVVKADEEAARIKKAAQEGKPVTEGKTAETGGGAVSTIEHWLGAE